jgi:tetratricopeptide (TPR) repeat protein
LLIGQRGLGKTTLLRRLGFAVEDDASLAAIWMPLVFPEEQYNVSGLAEFWLNCVDALGDALDHAGDAAAASALDSKVSALNADGDRAGDALALLLDEAGRLSRRLLLLVDNIDIVFDRLAKEEEWAFRRVISSESRLLIVGASSRALEAFYQYGRPFYDFFQIHELKGFEEREMFDVLRQLAEEANNPDVARLIREQPARIRALRVLTGGNPRTLMVLFKVLALGPEGDVQRDMEQLLDEYTALYKARFEELPPVSRQVVDAMAIHWDPLTAADLTERLKPMTVNQVSAQLARLEDFGVVEKTPWFGGKKNAYQIAERFFNIWYLMRASRRARRRLVWLVKFLEVWFGRDELDARARALLERDPDAVGREQYLDWALAYSQTVRDRYLRRSLESAGLRAVMESGADRNIDFSDLPDELRDHKARMESMRALKRHVLHSRTEWGGIDPEEFWRVFAPLGKPPTVPAVAFISKLPADSIKTVFREFRSVEQSLLFFLHPHAGAVHRFYQAVGEGEIEDGFDYENVIAIAHRYEEPLLPLAGLLGEDPLPAEAVFRKLTEEPGFEAVAWFGLGWALEGQAGRNTEAVQAYERAGQVDVTFAWPYVGIGSTFETDGRFQEAESAYHRAIVLEPKCAIAWAHLAGLLATVNRLDEAEEAYRSSIALFSEYAPVWSDMGNLLRRRGCYSDAAQSFRRALELVPNEAQTEFALVETLTRSGEWPDAATVLRRLAGDESTKFDASAFAAIIEAGHVAPAIAILEETGAKQRWRPLYEALCAVRAGSPEYLRTVAPEVRLVAEEILTQLAPFLFANQTGSSAR